MNEVNYKKLENNDVKESKKKKIVTNLLGLLNKQIIKIVLIILVLFVAIDVVDKSRKFYGVNVPFTQTKYIYSYDVIVKAGIDFSQVDWGEAGNNTVNVIVPEIKVLSKELKKDSFKVYQ